jgi:hypothetical protein
MSLNISYQFISISQESYNLFQERWALQSNIVLLIGPINDPKSITISLPHLSIVWASQWFGEYERVYCEIEEWCGVEECWGDIDWFYIAGVLCECCWAVDY